MDYHQYLGSVLNGSYRLDSLIRVGGMGAVFKGSHTRLPRHFAIKVLPLDSQDNPELVIRFQREAEITAALQHPHIVQVTDYNVAELGVPYLVMELLEGVDLRRRLARRGLPSLSFLRTLVAQGTAALAAAHQIGVVHRDLKPSNLFLCPRAQGFHLKVLDFGVSKIVGTQSEVTSTQASIGTPRYMAPEQARGRAGEVDSRTDIFALCTMVYEMLTGSSPFAAESIPSMLYRIVHEDPTPLSSLRPELPASLVGAVHRGMEKAREARYGSMIELGQVLDHAFAEAIATGIEPPERQQDTIVAGPDDSAPSRTGPPTAAGRRPWPTPSASPLSGSRERMRAPEAEPRGGAKRTGCSESEARASPEPEDLDGVTKIHTGPAPPVAGALEATHTGPQVPLADGQTRETTMPHENSAGFAAVLSESAGGRPSLAPPAGARPTLTPPVPMLEDNDALTELQSGSHPPVFGPTAVTNPGRALPPSASAAQMPPGAPPLPSDVTGLSPEASAPTPMPPLVPSSSPVVAAPDGLVAEEVPHRGRRVIVLSAICTLAVALIAGLFVLAFGGDDEPVVRVVGGAEAGSAVSKPQVSGLEGAKGADAGVEVSSKGAADASAGAARSKADSAAAVPAKVTRALRLTSRPSGARVLLGSKLLGRTPLIAVPIATEALRLRVARRGHQTRSLSVPAGRADVSLSVILKRAAPRPGRLRVMTRHEGKMLWANISLDGQPKGQSPAVLKVSAGRHRLDARRSGYGKASRTVTVRSGGQQSVVLELK